MRPSAIKGFVCAVFTSFLVIACAGTKLTSTQVDEVRRGKPVADILVIGVTYKEDTRRLFEDTLVAQLKAAGVKAVSSLDAIPISEKQQLEKERILKAVNEFKNDAVIITHVVGVEEKEVITRDFPGGGSYYGHYLWAYGNTHSPGFSSAHKIVRLATNLYDVQTEKLIWSGRSETMKPDSITQTIDDVIKVIIKDLQNNKLLPPK